MRVLSLFDGISCGQVALRRVGIPVKIYLASEIHDKSIKVTQTNFSETVQLGDVTRIKADDVNKIDLLIGGSPCQGFSFAGKQLNFQDERSKLFFEYVRLLKETKPKWFILENVRMKSKFSKIITDTLEVESIVINSNLVSAQNRYRMYWTNIPVNVDNIQNRNIMLKDILQLEVRDILTDEHLDRIKKQKRWGNHFGTIKTPKSPCLVRNGKSDVLILEDLKRYLTPIECERLQTLPDNYTSCINNTERYGVLGDAWTVNVIVEILKGIV